MISSGSFAPPDFSDLDALARALLARYPEAAPVAPLRVLGQGFFSLAVATPSGMLFRLATDPQVGERYEKEQRVLRWLATERLPLATPQHRWLLPRDDSFPFGGVGYPLLPGRTLEQADVDGPRRAQIASQLATFAHALHTRPVAQARAHGVPDGRAYNRAWYESDRAVSELALAPLLTAPELRHVARFWDGFMAAFDARLYEPVMTHGDLGDTNLLVDPATSSLCAVLDWEHCALSDPLDDLRNLQYFGRDFFFEVARAYEQLGGAVVTDLAVRLDWHFQHDVFPGIRRAFVRGEVLDADVIRRKLREHHVLP